MVKQVVFLVGGRGTRLGALSDKTPKPLQPVAGRPFLDYPVLHAMGHGVERFTLLGGYLGEQVENYTAAWRARGVAMDCILENQPAGTGGALHHARNLVEDEFYLCNGDSFFGLDLTDLPRTAPGENSVARLALRPCPDTTRYGRVETEGERIVGFSEKGTAGPGTINGGVYLLSRKIFDFLPSTPCSLEQDVFPKLAAKGHMFGRVYSAQFIDIGIPEDLARAQYLFACANLATVGPSGSIR